MDLHVERAGCTVLALAIVGAGYVVWLIWQLVTAFLG